MIASQMSGDGETILLQPVNSSTFQFHSDMHVWRHQKMKVHKVGTLAQPLPAVW